MQLAVRNIKYMITCEEKKKFALVSEGDTKIVKLKQRQTMHTYTCIRTYIYMHKYIYIYICISIFIYSLLYPLMYIVFLLICGKMV